MSEQTENLEESKSPLKVTKKLRKGDKGDGDTTIIPSATPLKDPTAKTQTAEEVDKLRVSMSGKTMNQLLDAVNKVTNKKD